MENYSLDTSLAETGTSLFTILLYLILIGLIAGILTLPLFFSVLFYISSWFRAFDVSKGAIKKTIATFLILFLPLHSLGGTILSFAYFGGFDWPLRVVGMSERFKKGPVEDQVSGVFDRITRDMVKKISPVTPNDPINWKKAPDTGTQLLELYQKEQLPPPPSPLEKMFPDPNPKPPTETPPQYTMPVLIEVAKIQQKNKANALVDTNPENSLDQEQINQLNTITELSSKTTMSNQNKMIYGIRGMFMYWCLVTGPIPLTIFLSSFIFGRRGVVLILRSISRSVLRTSLTYLAVFVLMFMLCCVWSILDFLGMITQQKDSNFKGIVTEKYQIPSQMSPSTYQSVKQIISEMPKDLQPDNIDDNIMTWAFVGGTLDPSKKTAQNSLFFFALEPQSVFKMMPGIEDLSEEETARLEKAADRMVKDPKGVIIGAEKLRQMGKRVGDRMRVTSLNYKDIVFDFEIIDEFPIGSRWEQSAVMNRQYLDNAMDEYRGKNGKEHPLSNKCMNLIWIRLPNQKSFEVLSERLSTSGKIQPAVKMEVESSAYANFLSPFKSMISFMRYALVPGLIVITTLVASLVISIGVRERRAEIAVLKVLGFRPWMVLGLVMGEALLIGTLSGFMSTATAFSMVNAQGGIGFPIAFFGKFYIPFDSLWWGPAVGGITSAIGAIFPSVTAYRIKASQVFSRLA